MFKYKISFEFDLDDVFRYDGDNQHTEINDIDDDCFQKAFSSKENINEFEEWFNDGLKDEDKISVISIKYNPYNELNGELLVTLSYKLKDMQSFAKELVNYLFEGDTPLVNYHVNEINYKDDWDYHNDSHIQKRVEMEYDDSASIDSYKNVKIIELN